MTMNRVQFQRGLSMAEFIQQYGADAHCDVALVVSYWPGYLPARHEAIQPAARSGAIGLAWTLTFLD